MNNTSTLIVIVALFVFSNAVLAASGTHHLNTQAGAICLGPNLSKVLEPNLSINISIDSSEKKPFGGHKGEILFDQLDLSANHRINLFRGKEKFDSFVINFKKLKTNFVVLWKAAGVWRVIPVGGEKCEWPVPTCPRGRDCP